MKKSAGELLHRRFSVCQKTS